MGKEVDLVVQKKYRKKYNKLQEKHLSNEIDFENQKEIRKLSHGATENFAEKLLLCIGISVMIRNNDATELCITKDQEGFVAGWQAKSGPYNKNILDTLFIKLDESSQTIQLEGLPENVVSVTMTTKTIECNFNNDLKEQVERQQVWILPNFAMIDYVSQRKTRPYNVVHLNSCRSHMSYYTCLSRSASAAGTIIIQGFEPTVITKRCSGYLRQKFREHEILDDITRLQFENQLPDNIQSNFRNELIYLYQQ